MKGWSQSFAIAAIVVALTSSLAHTQSADLELAQGRIIAFALSGANPFVGE